MTLGAKRMGLTTSNIETLEAVRDMFNLISLEIVSLTKWRFLFKNASFYTTVTFPYVVASGTPLSTDTTLTGGTSGATATLNSIDTTELLIYARNLSKAFSTGEVITMTGSGATVTLGTAVGTTLYDLAADFTIPLSFRNETQDRNLPFEDPEDYDRLDPDHDMTGIIEEYVLLTINNATGRWQFAANPRPGTAGDGDNDVIQYRYYGSIPEFTSSNDSTDMDLYIPPYLQKAYIHGIPALFLEEKGAHTHAAREREHMADAVARALTMNMWMGEDPEDRLARHGDLTDEFSGAIVIHAQGPAA